MSFFQKVETALTGRNFSYLKHLELYYGQEVRLFKVKKDNYSKVYGHVSGKKEENCINLYGVIINGDVIPVGPASSGTFTTGFFYTRQEDQVNAGDRIELTSQDNRPRSFEVVAKKIYGSSTQVFYRYELSAVGD